MLNRILVLVAFAFTGSAAAFSVNGGHRYATSEYAILEYDQAGLLLGSLPVDNAGLRGIAAGPGGNLYVVVQPSDDGTPRVDVIRGSGDVVRTFPFTGALTTHAGTGKIAFSPDQQTFYVSSASGVYRFDTHGTSGALFIAGFCTDVEVLPSGELLVAESGISRYSADGMLLDSFNTMSDPSNLANGGNLALTDVQGVAYSGLRDVTYVTMLGHTGMEFRVLALAGVSNVLVDMEYYLYGSDIQVAGDTLVIGSRIQAPGMFTGDLQYMGQFEGPAAGFVASFGASIFSDGFELGAGP